MELETHLNWVGQLWSNTCGSMPNNDHHPMQNPLWRDRINLIFLPSCSFSAVDVYFPTTSVKFNLPINEESESIFSKIPLAQFQVLRMEDNRLASDYLYSLEQNPLLRINSSSGEIYMRTDYRSPNSSATFLVTAFPRDQPDHELLNVSHLSLEVTPQPLEEYCSELEHICFWSSAQYTIAESHGPYRRKDFFWTRTYRRP